METVKEKLVKILKDLHINCTVGVTHCDECEFQVFAASCCCENLIADRLVKHGVTIQEWVSVDEPPKEDGRYLVFSEYEEGTGMVDALYEKDRGEFGDYAWYWSEARGEYKVWVEFKYVTHWMPLPDLPKGVQEYA